MDFLGWVRCGAERALQVCGVTETGTCTEAARRQFSSQSLRDKRSERGTERTGSLGREGERIQGSTVDWTGYA